MASGVQQRIQDAEASSDKAGTYEQIIREVSKSGSISIADFKALTDFTFDDSFGIVILRNLLVQLVSALEKVDDHTKIEVGNYVLVKLTEQSASFEEHNTQIRALVAAAHEREEDWQAAAEVLAGIQLDSAQRKFTPEEKAQYWIRIIRNYLEDDNTISAETYLNKYKNISHLVKDPDLQVHFQLSQARILDARRDFLGAAKGYQNLSVNFSIDEEERLHCLSNSIICAVLAPAGPLRSRALKTLYTDERTVGRDEFGILEKMFLNRLVSPAQVDKFAEKLQPHQKAKTADGSTVLAKAMSEHNLIGTSRLYNNIGFDELGAILGVDGDRAESMTAAMIESGRLVGRIDQIDRSIFFESGEASGEQGSDRVQAIAGKELRRWDANVESLAECVEALVSSIQEAHPEFVATYLSI